MHVSNRFHIYGPNLTGHHLGGAGFRIGFILFSRRQSAVTLCKPAGQHLSQLLVRLRRKYKLSGAGTPQLSKSIFSSTPPPSCKPSSSMVAPCMARLLPVCFNLFIATSDQFFIPILFLLSHTSTHIYRVPRNPLSCICSPSIYLVAHS